MLGSGLVSNLVEATVLPLERPNVPNHEVDEESGSLGNSIVEGPASGSSTAGVGIGVGGTMVLVESDFSSP